MTRVFIIPETARMNYGLKPSARFMDWTGK